MSLIMVISACAVCGNKVAVGEREQRMLRDMPTAAAVCGQCESEIKEAKAKCHYPKLQAIQARALARAAALLPN